MGLHAEGLVAVDHDRAGAPADHVHDRLEGGAAPGAVAAEQGHQLATLHVEVDAVEDMRLAVEGVQVADPQHLGAVVLGSGRAGLAQGLGCLTHALASSSAAASLPM